MIGNTLKTLLAPAVRSAIQRRSQSVIAGPATVHVPKGEKIALGTVMVGSWLFIPIWVLLHVKEYRGEK